MDVDELWESMKAEGSSAAARKPTGVAAFNSVKLKAADKKPKAKPVIPGLSFKSSGAGAALDPFGEPVVATAAPPAREADVPSSSSDLAGTALALVKGSGEAATVTAEDARPLASFASFDELQAYYQRYINAIGDESTAVRRKALERLSAGLNQSDTLSPQAEDLLRPLFPVMMKPLLKRFADPIEKCREIAVDLVRQPSLPCFSWACVFCV